jgi:hypothetical protein
MAISYNDPFHFHADELMKRRPHNLDEEREPGPIPPARNPADPFGGPRPWLSPYRDDLRTLPAPGLPPPNVPTFPPPGPGNPFPDPGPSPKLQLPRENRAPLPPPPIYVDPPGDNFDNDPHQKFFVTEDRSMRAVEPPAGGLLGLLQAMMPQRDAGPNTGSAISPNGTPATRPDNDGSVPDNFLRRPPLQPQDQDEADPAQQAREAAAAQLVRGVRRLARINRDAR